MADGVQRHCRNEHISNGCLCWTLLLCFILLSKLPSRDCSMCSAVRLSIRILTWQCRLSRFFTHTRTGQEPWYSCAFDEATTWVLDRVESRLKHHLHRQSCAFTYDSTAE
eukprot:6212695-Pleurochrysis_carterae.AAC.1